MNENEKIKEIFTKEGAGWLDFEAGMALFGGNPKLYVKIIKIFADNIESHLDRLSGVEPEGIADYAIEVHGIKGSLYGIAANKEGDMAMELEVAAKKGLYEKICHENDVFIETVRDFAAKLRVLLTALERAEGDGRERPEPDKAALAAMLKAGRDFDVDKMQEILQELEQYEYERNGELVKWLSEQVTAFSYGKIEKRLAEIL